MLEYISATNYFSDFKSGRGTNRQYNHNFVSSKLLFTRLLSLIEMITKIVILLGGAWASEIRAAGIPQNSATKGEPN